MELINNTKKHYNLIIQMIITLLSFFTPLFAISIASITMWGMFLISISIINYISYNKKIISFTLIFILSFILFQFGQPIVYSFNIKFDYYYFNLFSNELIIEAIEITIMSIIFFLLGVFLIPKRKIKNDSFIEKNNETLENNLNILFVIIYIIVLIISAYRFLLAYQNGYLAVREFNDNLPKYISVLDTVFIVVSISLIIITNNVKKKNLIFILAIIWSLLNAGSGLRTLGLIAFVLYLLVFYFVNIERFKEIKIIKRILIIIGVVILVLSLITIIMYFRTPEYRNNVNSSIKIMFEPIYEMGFNFNNLTMTMAHRVEMNGYRNGSTYLYSILSIFPRSLDPTGNIASFNEKALLAEKLTEVMKYNFGTGYSLIAEGYLNFANLGFIVFIPIGYLVGYFLDFDLKNNKLRQFNAIILFYMILTAPRREFYYIANGIIYSIVYYPLLLKLISLKKISFTNIKEINEDEV